MRSIQQIVEEQAQRWQRLRSKAAEAPPSISVVTLSREPGSGGRLVAEGIAEALGMDVFHQEMLHEMAQNANISMRIMETLDEKGMNVLEEYISSLVLREHLWPDEYLKQLMNVIGTIGRHGHAVIIGRGASFMLPAGHCLRVRVVAPKEFRVQQVMAQFDVSHEEALRRITRTDSDRKAFTRKYFNCDIADPLHYDLILNTSTLSIIQCVAIVTGAIQHECKV